jgi:hypothetical protein
VNGAVFHRGEIAIVLVSCDCGRCYAAGDEVEVLEGLAERRFMERHEIKSEPVYVVQRAGSMRVVVRPHELRKKQPPGELRSVLDSDATPNAAGSWEDSPWWPEHVTQRVPA